MLYINIITGVKRCGKCAQYKSLTDFPRDATHSDGVRSKCKACCKIYLDGWYEARKHKPKIIKTPVRSHRAGIVAMRVNLVDSLKYCYACKNYKAHTAFSKNSAATFGLNARCRACDALYHKKWIQQDPVRNKALNNAAVKRSYYKNHERMLEKGKKTNWFYRLNRYNITYNQYMELLEQQNYCCAICQRTSPGGRGVKWNIDHDHSCCDGRFSCGKCIRGLLCNSCNRGIGHMQDNPSNLRSAASYIESYQSQKVNEFISATR